MRCLVFIALLLAGCNAPPICFTEEDVEFPAWVSRAYLPMDDAGVIVEVSDMDLITRHDSEAMACGGSYSCRVGWRRTTDSRIPSWIECEVETEPSVWGCIHAKQPRPLYRFSLSPAGRKWRADIPLPLTPWLDAVLVAIRIERVWHTFQICWDELKSDRYVAVVLGWFEGDEDWSHRELTAVSGADGLWRATWVPRIP